jgi:hypothetical protein
VPCNKAPCSTWYHLLAIGDGRGRSREGGGGSGGEGKKDRREGEGGGGGGVLRGVPISDFNLI